MFTVPTEISFAQALTFRILGSVITLYMLAILLRWLGPYIEISFYHGPLRFIPVVADPPIKLMRRILPPMGPMDWSPIAALMAVWIVRIVVVGY